MTSREFISKKCKEKGLKTPYTNISFGIEDWCDLMEEYAALNKVASSQPIISESEEKPINFGLDMAAKGTHSIHAETEVQRTASGEIQLMPLNMQSDFVIPLHLLPLFKKEPDER